MKLRKCRYFRTYEDILTRKCSLLVKSQRGQKQAELAKFHKCWSTNIERKQEGKTIEHSVKYSSRYAKSAKNNCKSLCVFSLISLSFLCRLFLIRYLDAICKRLKPLNVYIVWGVYKNLNKFPIFLNLLSNVK